MSSNIDKNKRNRLFHNSIYAFFPPQNQPVAATQSRRRSAASYQEDVQTFPAVSTFMLPILKVKGSAVVGRVGSTIITVVGAEPKQCN